MAKHLDTGKRGEDLALQFLQEQGYTIVCRNWRFKRLEVDLIVEKDQILVFVEVKTRSQLAFGTPDSFVDIRKQRLLIDASENYLAMHLHDGDIRFDIMAIYLSPIGTAKIEHIKDAFWDYGC